MTRAKSMSCQRPIRLCSRGRPIPSASRETGPGCTSGCGRASLTCSKIAGAWARGTKTIQENKINKPPHKHKRVRSGATSAVAVAAYGLPLQNMIPIPPTEQRPLLVRRDVLQVYPGAQRWLRHCRMGGSTALVQRQNRNQGSIVSVVSISCRGRRSQSSVVPMTYVFVIPTLT